jgi:hypothetical protein
MGHRLYTVIALEGGALECCGFNMKCSAGRALSAVLGPLGPASFRSGCNRCQTHLLTKYGKCGYDHCIDGCSSAGKADTALMA